MPNVSVGQVITGQFGGGVQPAAIHAVSVGASMMLSFTTVLQLKPHSRFDATAIWHPGTPEKQVFAARTCVAY